MYDRHSSLLYCIRTPAVMLAWLALTHYPSVVSTRYVTPRALSRAFSLNALVSGEGMHRIERGVCVPFTKYGERMCSVFEIPLIRS